jgi:hypothetical protein
MFINIVLPIAAFLRAVYIVGDADVSLEQHSTRSLVLVGHRAHDVV